MRVVGWRQAGRFPSIFSLALQPHMCGARLWHPNAAMATDCDVSNPRPGPHTTLGCELIERWWAYRLRQGWTAAPGPRCQPEGCLASRPCLGFSPPSCSSLRAPAHSAPSPPPPQRTGASWRLLGWVSISVILFCFLKILPACSSRWRRCSLAVPFFRSDLLAGGLAQTAASDLAACP